MSLFAQELGTAETVPAVKLDRALAALQHGIRVAATETTVGPVAKAILAARQRNRRIHATAAVGVGRIDFPCFRWHRARGGTRHGCATRGGRRRGRRGWRDSRQRGDHRRSGAGSYGFFGGVEAG